MADEVTVYTDYLLESEMYSRIVLLIFCYQGKIKFTDISSLFF